MVKSEGTLVIESSGHYMYDKYYTCTHIMIHQYMHIYNAKHPRNVCIIHTFTLKFNYLASWRDERGLRTGK